jgi:hypothetical protein
MMTRSAILAVVAALLAGAPTGAEASQVREALARELPLYGFRDVDVGRLTTSQVVQIYTIMHSPRSQGDKRRIIRSALGRGLFGGFTREFGRN